MTENLSLMEWQLVPKRGVTEVVSLAEGEWKVLPLTELLHCHGRTCASVTVDVDPGSQCQALSAINLAPRFRR